MNYLEVIVIKYIKISCDIFNESEIFNTGSKDYSFFL